MNPYEIRTFICTLELRIALGGDQISSYMVGPKDVHTACFIAIAQAHIDELEYVIDCLEKKLPPHGVN